MRRHLKIFVKEVLFRDDQQPQDTNRRYFPKTSDLRTHMYRATVKNRLSRIDQANVHMKTDEWRKVYNADSFFFRPHSEQVNAPMEVPVWSFLGCKVLRHFPKHILHPSFLPLPD